MKKSAVTILLYVFYFSVLATVLMPYFLCAPFARQSADDWSYGCEVYNIVKNGGSFFDCIVASLIGVFDTYRIWEGRYFSVFLNAFNPANWNEKYYAIVPFILIFSQVVGQAFFYFIILKKHTRRYIPYILIPPLVMQFLYIGDVSQVYFWYVGGIGYTFEHALAYAQWGIILALAFGNFEGKKRTVISIVSYVLAFLISGGNYASALSTICITFLVTLHLFFKNRKRFFQTMPIFLIGMIGILISVLSPGNLGRLNANFGGKTNGFFDSIFISLWNTAQNIYSWFVYNKGWVVLLMSAPAVILISRELTHKIKHPFCILFLTYGIYATEMVANIYVEGNSGGWRNGAILYGSYYVFLVFNLICISSWFFTRIHISDKMFGNISKYGIQFGTMIFAVMLAVILLSGEYKTTASYTAYRDYRQGIAREFARQWDERFEILRDDSIKDPVFYQLTEPRCVTLEYTDLQLPDGYLWVNEDCRKYYDKSSITVLP